MRCRNRRFENHGVLMYVSSGTFVSTGVAVTINTVHSADIFILIPIPDAVQVGQWWLAARTMPADSFFHTYSLYSIGGFLGINFLINEVTIGTGILAGTSGLRYVWLGIQSQNDAKVIYWSGNGADNRTISGCGFQPDYVLAGMTVIAGSSLTRIWHKSLGGDQSGQYIESATWDTDYIQGVHADGITVGTKSNINTTSNLAFCFKSGNRCEVGTWTGAGGAGNRVVSLVEITQPIATLSNWKKTAINPQCSRGPYCTLYNNAGNGNQINTVGQTTQSHVALGTTTFTVDTIWDLLNSLNYFIAFSYGPTTPTAVGNTPSQSISRGSPLYPSATGNPGEYEFHKTVRKAMRQFNNLTLGD